LLPALRFRSRTTTRSPARTMPTHGVDEARENYSRIKREKREEEEGGRRPRALSLLRSINLRSLAFRPRIVPRLRRAQSSEINRFIARVPPRGSRGALKDRHGVINAASSKNDNRLHASLMSASNGLHCASVNRRGGAEGDCGSN